MIAKANISNQKKYYLKAKTNQANISVPVGVYTNNIDPSLHRASCTRVRYRYLVWALPQTSNPQRETHRKERRVRKISIACASLRRGIRVPLQP